MSAFVVEEKTINTIVHYIFNSSRENFKHPVIEKITNANKPNELIRKMVKMNVDAVKQRYGDNTNQMIPAYEYEFKLVITNKIQIYKAIQCYLYQCTEGNIPERQLYKNLVIIKNILAETIINKLPEYYWG